MRIEVDKFNSNIFGLKMGNVVDCAETIKAEDVRDMILSAKSNGFQHLNAKVSADKKEAVNIMLQNGFKLVDTQLMYQIDVKISEEYWPDNIIFRSYRKDDCVQIADIAREAYTLDQFHSDKVLPSYLCDKYYVEWMNNSCNGFADKVMVLSRDTAIAGYITLNYESDYSAVVGLAAIGKQFQHKGYFTYLIGETLKMLFEEGITRMMYGTQLVNRPVLHTMSRYSGIPIYSNHILHRIV